MPNKDYIVGGKILNTHGIKGWLIIRSYTHPVENIFEYDLSINSSDGFQELRIDEYRILPKKVIIKIKSIDTINNTEPYINQEIFVSKQDLPVTDKNEYYWHQLIGREVFNENKKRIGLVKSIFPTKSNDVLVLECPSDDKKNEEILIPFIKDYVLQVSDKEDIIIVKWENEF